MGELSWNLADPDLGHLERLGVAGMAMALQEAERLEHDLAPLTWSISAEQLTLEWPEETADQVALTPLVRWAWCTTPTGSGDEEDGGLGVFWFPAIHRGDRGEFRSRLGIHNGILWSFLQHPRTQPKTKMRRVNLQLGEQQQIEVGFVEPRKNLCYPRDFERGLFSGERLRATVKLSSYLFPGSTARHAGEGSWEGPAHLAFPLFFAPTVCYYLHLRNFGWVIVAPDVRDLDFFSRMRRRLGLAHHDLHTTNLADAGLRVLLGLHTQMLAEQVEQRTGVLFQCEVYSVGDVTWNRQQVRNHSLRIRPGLQALERYRLLEACLPNAFRARDGEESGFISVPLPRGRIAENLLRSQYWYKDLFEVPREISDAVDRQTRANESLQRTWYRMLRSYYPNQLRDFMEQMHQLEPNATDEAFTAAFHHALRRLFAREASHAERGTRSVAERQQALVEKVRRTLTRAQTRSLLREAIASLFAEAGTTPTLREHGRDIWQMIDGQHTWRRARDLALISMVTYQSQAGDAEETQDAEDSETT